jgi:CAAX protease family protein
MTVTARRLWLAPASVLALLACVFAAAAMVYIRRYAMSAPAVAGIYGSFLLLLILVLAPGFRSSRHLIEIHLRPKLIAVLLSIALCVCYLIYAVGTADFRLSALGRVLALAALPCSVYVLAPVRRLSRFGWQDVCVAVFLIAAVLSGVLKGIWAVPANLDFMARLALIAVASWCWIFLRPVPELGYEFRLSRQVLRAALLNFLLFAAIAIPSGWLIGFTAWNVRWHSGGAFGLDFLEIFLFIALLEETFFRGFLQSLLTDSFGSWWKAQLVVSVLFGLFHILHAPFPNWRYVLLATIAGWFYGSAYRNGGGVVASSLTHALVDTVWRTWFTRLLP